MDIGLHASMLGRMGLVEGVERAAALGADAFEIDIDLGGADDAWQERRTGWEERLTRATSAARRLGVRLPSFCLGALWRYSLADERAEYRECGIEVVRDAVGWAERFGVGVLLLPVGQPVGTAPEVARRRLRDSLRVCAEDAERSGIVLALENLAQPMLWHAADFVELLDEIDSPSCGVYFDIGNHLATGEDPAAAIERLGSRVVRVHLKDSIRRSRTVSMPAWTTGVFDAWTARTTVDLGRGEVEWSAVRRALTSIDYRDGLIIEVPQIGERAVRGCAENLAAARRLLG